MHRLLVLTRGIFPLDKGDDMGRLKEQMLATDFVILGSPV